VQELTQKWQEVRELVPKRDAVLQAEMVRQQNNERLRQQFAAKANAIGQWLESRLDQVASLGLQKGSLEDHLKILQSLDNEAAEYQPHVKELEKYNHEVQEALVFDNPHTPYTMEVSCVSSPYSVLMCSLLVHGQVTIIFLVSVGLSVCLSVCAEFFSAVFYPISIKLGHMLYVWV